MIKYAYKNDIHRPQLQHDLDQEIWIDNWLLFILSWYNTQLIFEYNSQGYCQSNHQICSCAELQPVAEGRFLRRQFYLFIALRCRWRGEVGREIIGGTVARWTFWYAFRLLVPLRAAFGYKNVIQCDSDRLESQRSVTSIHLPGQNMIQCITDWMEYVISRNGEKFLILIVPRFLLFPTLITTQHIY